MWKLCTLRQSVDFIIVLNSDYREIIIMRLARMSTIHTHQVVQNQDVINILGGEGEEASRVV